MTTYKGRRKILLPKTINIAVKIDPDELDGVKIGNISKNGDRFLEKCKRRQKETQ